MSENTGVMDSAAAIQERVRQALAVGESLDIYGG